MSLFAGHCWHSRGSLPCKEHIAQDLLIHSAKVGRRKRRLYPRAGPEQDDQYASTSGYQPRVGRPRKGRKPKSGLPPPPLTPSGDPLSEWTMDNRKELAAFMVDPQKDDLFDETDFPSLALEEEQEEHDFDARRRSMLRARFMSEAPVVFSKDVDDPRLRWKNHSVEWVHSEPRYQTLEDEALQWFWELQTESARKEAMEIHQKHRELGASHFGLANAMGTYMQKLEEEDVKNKDEEYAIPSWMRANIKIEENWDRFQHAQELAEGGRELVAQWSEELNDKGIPEMLSRWAPELLEGEKEAEDPPAPIDAYLNGTLPGADEPPEEGEVVYQPPDAPRKPVQFWGNAVPNDYVLTPVVDQVGTGPDDNWAAEEHDPLQGNESGSDAPQSDAPPDDDDVEILS